MNLIKKIIEITRKKYSIVVFAVLVSFILICVYFINVVNPLIINSSEVKVKSLTIKAVNSAISDVIAESVIYNDLVSIVTDDDGKIVMINANSILINKLTKELVKATQEKLKDASNEDLKIPVGNFTGISILLGVGPNVKIHLMPIGAVRCDFESKFETSGINQTHHRIYVNIEASVNMILPIKRISVTSVSQVLITESIIVGEVPNTYLYSNSMQDMLDLIPD